MDEEFQLILPRLISDIRCQIQGSHELGTTCMYDHEINAPTIQDVPPSLKCYMYKYVARKFPQIHTQVKNQEII